mgnify:CR=1 FL=1
MAWYDAYFGGTTTSTPTVNTSNNNRGWRNEERDDPIVSVNEAINTPNISNNRAWDDSPREQGIVANINDNMPIDVPPITQTQTGGDFGGYETPQQQLAASLMDAGQVAGNLGAGLFTSTPVEYPENVTPEQILGADDPWDIGGIQYDLPDNVYYSTYGPQAQAHSPTGLIEITGESGIPAYIGRDEDGNLIPNPDPNANQYTVFNPYEGYSEPAWDSWADPWNEGYYQGEADSMSDLARDYWFSESLADVAARKEERRKAGLGPAGMRASEMERMYDREFAAKANPLHDPGYSQQVTEELDPMYAGRELFELART